MEMLAALDELEAAWNKLASLPVDALGAGQVPAVLDRPETHRRRQPTAEHALLNHLQSRATAKETGSKSWRTRPATTRAPSQIALRRSEPPPPPCDGLRIAGAEPLQPVGVGRRRHRGHRKVPVVGNQ